MKVINSVLGPVVMALVAVLVAVPAVAAAAITSVLAGSHGSGPAEPATVATAGAGPGVIPPEMLAAYRAAPAVCPGLSWTVLAAIGTVESGNDTSTLPGVRSGSNAAGAEGPMQFEPATFAAYARPVPPGGAEPPNPYDPRDAVFAAARMLCADGASTAAGLPSAVFAYNHSAAYVADVLSIAAGYADDARPPGEGRSGGGPTGVASGGVDGAGIVALAYAEAQIGVPYRWGAEDPGVAFDCSGLAQAAWSAAGITIPRIAEDQFHAGPAVPSGAGLAPGDLVFFGSSTADVTHVGIVVDPAGEMVDAPHTGSVVRLEAFTPVIGAAWGGDVLVGATRPG